MIEKGLFFGCEWMPFFKLHTRDSGGFRRIPNTFGVVGTGRFQGLLESLTAIVLFDRRTKVGVIDAQDAVENVDAREVVDCEDGAPLIKVLDPAEALTLARLFIALEEHPFDLAVLREDDHDVALVELERKTAHKDPRRVGVLLMPRCRKGDAELDLPLVDPSEGLSGLHLDAVPQPARERRKKENENEDGVCL